MSSTPRVGSTGATAGLRAMTGSPYETTGPGRRSVFMRAPNYGPNSAIRYSGPQLRDQSRDAVRKNGYASVIADRLTANIVGTGIVPQPPSRKARALWDEWTNWAAPDGALDFYGLQAQAVRGMIVGGEVFGRLRYRYASDMPGTVPLQIQVLEAEYVATDKEDALAGGGFIQQGIEIGPIGRREAYWMYRQHPADCLVSASFDPIPVRVPASEVLHVYDAMARPGQLRGEPWLTRALAKLKDLDAYDDAELTRKKISALLVGFIKTSFPQGMDEEDLQEIWGLGSKVEDGVGQIVMEPGTINQLAPGEEMEWSNPQDVGGQYDAFMRQQLMALASFSGLLYEQLTGDYSKVNDRTWRAAFNEFKRRCETLQHHIVVHQFCAPIWRRWAQMAIMSGMLSPEEAPSTVKWVPQSWAYINPKQDVEAAQMEIRAGLASRDEKAAERGRNVADIDREQAADNERADKFGLKHDSDGRSNNKAAASVAAAKSQPTKAEALPSRTAVDPGFSRSPEDLAKHTFEASDRIDEVQFKDRKDGWRRFFRRR